jgi:hypothetical protein
VLRYRITLSRLEEQFKDRAVSREQMEAAIAEQLAKETICAPWRRSEAERAGCSEGMWQAGSSFFRSTGRRCEISTEQARIAKKKVWLFDRAW